jgi:hypothetical protein
MAHNGWSNYATWRVHLELFEEYEFFIDYTTENLEDYVYDYIEQDCSNQLTLDYANAFISEVDFNEIYNAIQDWKNEYKCPECDKDVEYKGHCSKKCEEASMH